MSSFNPSTPSASGFKDGGADDSSPQKYVPQFSATTEMILKRINGGNGSGGGSLGANGLPIQPPGYEDMRRSVLMSMKTSHNMELPAQPLNPRQRGQGGRASVGSASSPGVAQAAIAPKPMSGGSSRNGTPKGGKGRGKGKAQARSGKKRKRSAKDESDMSESSESLAMSGLGGESDEDEEDAPSEFPKMTQSGRAINKPAQFVPAISDSAPRKRAPSKRSQEQALCKRCQRGHSPSSNMIVFCDGCNNGWHQSCHDPAISDEDVKNESADWYCADCSAKRGGNQVTAPLEQPKQFISWAGRSSDEKRRYLSSLSQLQLVNLLVQVTTIHPQLPIFPATPPPSSSQQQTQQAQQLPLQAPRSTGPIPWSTSFSKPDAGSSSQGQQRPFPASNTGALFARAEAAPNATMNFIRKIPPGQKHSTPPSNNSSPFNGPASFTHASSAPPTLPPQSGTIVVDGDNNDSRESTPNSPPYPKAGNGLMAKLGPDDQDIDWLVDANDFDAFSGTVYDDQGNPTNIH